MSRFDSLKTNVTFLSLGPGDPELLTLKVARLLREADVVVVPVTQNADGTMKSRAADIIGEWLETDKMSYYTLPMQRNREAVMQVYDSMCSDIAEWYQSGRQVVVAVEGDVSIYASIHYVLERLQQQSIPVTQQPGIPSFIAAAASANLSLISQDERLVVLPGDADVETLMQLLNTNHVVVIMKLSQCQKEVKTLLRQQPQMKCQYFENVGTPEAFLTTDHDVMMKRQMPYFSLCILFPI